MEIPPDFLLRKIIHVDMDAFFASIEQRDNPELKGKPVAVGGGGMRGVVASASYEARRYGVRSAMPGVTAQKLCPNIIFVKSRFPAYIEASRQIREIFHEYTDLVEPLSLDEAYLDVTENKKGIHAAMRIAHEIRQRIFEETQLTASAGVSFNKFLAKIASDINKPNGMKVILPEEAIEFLEKLPIEKFHGIGMVTAERMHKMGIRSGADLKRFSEIELAQRFGKAGRHYFKIVRAEDDRPVNPNRVRKSIGAERTFSADIFSTEEMKKRLEDIAEIVYNHLQKNDNFGRTVTLKVKTSDFKIISRSKTFGGEVRTLEALRDSAFDLLDGSRGDFGAVRLLGISVSNLEKEQLAEGIQLEFDF
ncbi:MAG: DNA polymerase IV [Lewinellaceae bacterium]|nr:DNA polymerase IV [Lewinellaceae bacterium]